MRREYTLHIVECDGWYAGFVEEIPGAHTQGKTVEEVKENIQEAIHLVLDANRRHMLDDETSAKIIDTTTISVDV
ncbi:MAG: type II toxin-antitoxin system HicB family antitoxin [Deltaproteobacteria bacterium]|nr:type II toxin-antitoxin system HicB family antitoxin [Deltaproteobacteria bacterium]